MSRSRSFFHKLKDGLLGEFCGVWHIAYSLVLVRRRMYLLRYRPDIRVPYNFIVPVENVRQSMCDILLPIWVISPVEDLPGFGRCTDAQMPQRGGSANLRLG